jgi:hypothetical protein
MKSIFIWHLSRKYNFREGTSPSVWLICRWNIILFFRASQNYKVVGQFENYNFDIKNKNYLHLTSYEKRYYFSNMTSASTQLLYAEILYNFLSILTSSKENIQNYKVSRRELQFSYENHLHPMSKSYDFLKGKFCSVTLHKRLICCWTPPTPNMPSTIMKSWFFAARQHTH